MDKIKAGDVIENKVPVLITRYGWMFDDCQAILSSDIVYPTGDHWIVEKIDENVSYYYLLHMSGKKAVVTYYRLRNSFRVGQ